MLSPGDTVWIKGSRAMQLDRVVDRLRADAGCKAAVA
jgi:UDP-N-acetylmuramyl pentapeptide synthase